MTHRLQSSPSPTITQAATQQLNRLLRMLKPTVNDRWFHDRPALSAGFGFSEYKQCTTGFGRLGFVRLPFNTMLVDLDKTPETLLASFQSRTRSVVRKAQRTGIESAVEPDHFRYIKFYNQFATARGLARLPSNHVLASPERSVVTKALLGERLLVTRGYLIDRKAGRARNLVNASIDYAEDDRETPRLIGMAHRYLVFQDMLLFRDKGLLTYDFGGYAVATTDPKLGNINRFKDSFGGRIVSEPNYRSWPLHLAFLLKAKLLDGRPISSNAAPFQGMAQ